jgi:hypothetical protein
MGHRLEDRASAARCPIQRTWTFAILCRSYGAAPRFGYGSYKDFAPTELRPSGDMSAANMYGPPRKSKISKGAPYERHICSPQPQNATSSVRSDIFIAHGRKRMGAAPLGATSNRVQRVGMCIAHRAAH